MLGGESSRFRVVFSTIMHGNSEISCLQKKKNEADTQRKIKNNNHVSSYRLQKYPIS